MNAKKFFAMKLIAKKNVPCMYKLKTTNDCTLHSNTATYEYIF